MDSIRIIEPNENGFGFKFGYNAGGFSGTMFLTYDLLEPNNEHRTLLLTKDAFLVNDEQRPEYERFLRVLGNYQSTSGNTYGAKAFVNAINSDELPRLPNVSVAVHRFGPVPVYLLTERFDVHFNGVKRQARIAIYPVERYEDEARRPVGVSTEVQFLDALTKKLDVVLMRYLEDVSEHLFDIEYHSDHDNALRRAKSVEAILGESIETKLDAILSTPSPSKRDRSAIEERQLYIRKMYRGVLLKAKFARLFALYFLNEMYDVLGFRSDDDYRSDLERIVQQDENTDYFENDDELSYLKDCLEKYWQSSINATSSRQTSSIRLWVKRFVHFARFMSLVRGVSKTKHNTKLFVSYHHDVPVSEIVRRGTSEVAAKHFPGEVEIVYVDQRTVGLDFKEQIKATIWLANGTLLVLPKSTDSINHGRKKGYDWIIGEGCHSLLLKKFVFFLEEFDIDAKEFEEAIARFDDSLAVESRGGSKTEDLRTAYKDQVKIEFSQQKFDPFDLNLEDRLRETMKFIVRDRFIRLVQGWLGMFEQVTATQIVKLNREIKYQASIHDVQRLLYGSSSSSNSRRFHNTVWKHVKRRARVHNDKNFALLINSGNGVKSRYEGGLQRFAEAMLQPSLFSKDERADALKSACSPFEKRP